MAHPESGIGRPAAGAPGRDEAGGGGGGCPAVSVIVRTVGRSGRLAEALASLAAQTRRDFEVVVVDMSESGAGGRAMDLAAPGLPALRRVAPGRRLPRPAALNAGIAAAAAPRIAILDDDNLYDPGHLELLLAGLDATGADYVYTGVRHATFGEDGVLLSCRDVAIPFRFDRVLLGNFVYATGSAYEKSVWRRLGGYDERFSVFEDWDFIIRVAAAARIVHLPEVSGESRKFTGRDGVSNFDLEIAAVRRCHAGIYWKHRGLLRGDLMRELKIVWADHCRRRVPPRTGFWERSVRGWRLEAGRDLVAWWASCLAAPAGGRNGS